MGKKSNGVLRARRLMERAARKGVDLSVPDNGPFPYVFASDGSSLFRVSVKG